VQAEVAVRHGSAKAEIGEPNDAIKSSLRNIMVLDLSSEKIGSEQN
jgi:hypothetical protein